MTRAASERPRFRLRRSGPRRAGVGGILISRLPGQSFVHRLTVLTKLLCVAALTVAVLINPNWQQVVAVAAVVIAAIAAARVPANAVPRLPLWFWLTLLVGMAFAAGGHGLGHFLNLVALSLLFTVLSTVIAWTTDVGDLVPTLVAFGRPLRRLGVPVDEWAVVSGLCVRSLPLMVEEFRTLRAARQLRRHGHRRRIWEAPAELVDLLTAALAATIRRATDMGVAIVGRGGARVTARPAARTWRDHLTVVLVGVSCVVPSILS